MVIIRKDNIKIAQSTDYLTGGLCSTYSVIRNLNSDSRYVPYLNLMPDCSPVFTGIVRSSYGTHLLDHLATDGAGLTGSQIAVVAFLQVNAHLGRGLHLELIHGGTSLGNVQLVGILAGHECNLLSCVNQAKACRLGIAMIDFPRIRAICVLRCW